MYNFLILGGDLRQHYLSRILKELGHQVITADKNNGSGFSLADAIKDSQVILCPMPFTKDQKTIYSAGQGGTLEITDLFKHLTQEHILFGGNIPGCVKEYAARCKIPCFDFLDAEELSIENTIATAEGAIAEAIRLSPGCLHKSGCLITGFGRCGKTLAVKLKGLSAKVTVADRDSVKLALADSLGMDTIALSEISRDIGEYRFIFNTIPASVIDEPLLRLMKPDVTIIDIASAPGGVDFSACQSLKISARLCPGLPGAYAPKASAEILSKAIIKSLS